MIRPGVKREFRYDSFAALIGSRSSGQLVGLARSTQFYTDVAFDLGSTRIEVTPFIGWVTAESLSANNQVGLTVKTATPLWETDNWNISGEYLFYLTHYEENQSGFTPSPVEPRAGGYFSPEVFLNQIPRLAATFTFDEKQDITFAAGPALQYIDETTQASVFRVGGDAHIAYTTRLSKPWLLKIMGDYTQIASVYTRIQGNALLMYTFY